IFLLFHSNKLQRLVDKQNLMLENYSQIDSMINTGNNDLVTAINEFLSNVPTEIDGKPVSPMDYVLYTKRVSDSLTMYKRMYNHAAGVYGLRIEYITTDSTWQVRAVDGT